MANNQDLPTILRAALRAYEQARAVRLQAERQASAQKERATAEINAAEQSERARLEASQRGQRALAEAEQARLGELAAAVTGLEEAARTALAQAGLAHIAGAPTAVDGAPAKARRGDAEVSDLFVQAQTGYVALREALYRLAAAQVEVGQGDAGRQTLQPLLADGASPFFPAAAALRRESYLRPAREALAAQAWETVRAALAPWLKENKTDEEASELERQSYLRPAQQALEAGQWEAVRTTLEPWLEKHKEDETAQAVYGDSYYRPGTSALEKKQWTDAQQIFDALVKFRSSFRNAKDLQRMSYTNAAKTALDAARYEEARSHALAWLAKNKDDGEAQGLLWETHFRSGQEAYDRKDWRTATLQWALAVGQKGNFKDVGSLLKTALHCWLDPFEIRAAISCTETASSVRALTCFG
ncbi:MAG: hypothetical protein IPM84_17570 [Anaerolineae bacterium]|nr:hypothetical protein [Anaerolineae bacterium]